MDKTKQCVPVFSFLLSKRLSQDQILYVFHSIDFLAVYCMCVSLNNNVKIAHILTLCRWKASICILLQFDYFAQY